MSWPPADHARLGRLPGPDRLAERFQVPAFLDNDANLMALGEFHVMAPETPMLLFVKAASGIGAGIVIDGQVFRGATGGSGDMGHIKLDESAQQNPCACGARGCLAAAASGGAIAHQLRELGRPVTSSRDAVRLAVHGDAQAVALIRQAGLLLGDVRATSVSLLNPDVLMVGGDLQLAQDHFMTALKERIYQRTQPLATREMRILTSVLGERSGIVGAAGHRRGLLGRVGRPDADRVIPGHSDRRLVAYGHSWVAGDGASRPDRRLVDVAARSLGMTPVNLGVGGSSSVQTASLVAGQGVPAADLYLVMTGLNDARLAGPAPERLDAYRRAVGVIVSGCRAAAPDATVLVVEQPPLVDYSQHPPHNLGSADALELYNELLRADLGGVAGVVLIRVVDWDPATMLAPDTVHPNDLGHATIGGAVAAAYRASVASSIGRTSPVHD